METHIDPDIILQEICMNLQFKSVARMMCASKSWYDNIRSPHFSKTYLKKIAEPDRWLLLCAPDRSLFYSLRFDGDEPIGPEMPTPGPMCDPAKRTEIVGHSNGLVCIFRPQSLAPAPRRTVEDCELIVWNPAIARFRTVPGMPRSDGRAYADLRRPPSFGFSYNPRLEDHEVVQIRQTDTAFEAWVYALGPDTWRRIADLDKRYSGVEISRVFFDKPSGCPNLNGRLHWLTERSPRRRVLAFDVEGERFEDFGVPGPAESWDDVRLSGLGDHLFLTQHWHRYPWENEIRVWGTTNTETEGPQCSWAELVRFGAGLARGPRYSWAELYHFRADNVGLYALFPVFSLVPLLRSKSAERARTLYAATLFQDSYLVWVEEESGQSFGLRGLGSVGVLVGTPFVPSFLLGDDSYSVRP